MSSNKTSFKLYIIINILEPPLILYIYWEPSLFLLFAKSRNSLYRRNYIINKTRGVLSVDFKGVAVIKIIIKYIIIKKHLLRVIKIFLV